MELSKHEQEFLANDPHALALLVEWHKIQQDRADLMNLGCKGDEQRAEELRNHGRPIVQKDPENWSAEVLAAFGIKGISTTVSWVELEAMRIRKNAAYEERNRVVSALARLFPSGLSRTAIEGWDPNWHGCVYIDLPTGQVSWHYHDSQAFLFKGLPPYTGEWDGHTTSQKYERLRLLGQCAPACITTAAGSRRPYCLQTGDRCARKVPMDVTHALERVLQTQESCVAHLRSQNPDDNYYGLMWMEDLEFLQSFLKASQ